MVWSTQDLDQRLLSPPQMHNSFSLPPSVATILQSVLGGNASNFHVVPQAFWNFKLSIS